MNNKTIIELLINKKSIINMIISFVPTVGGVFLGYFLSLIHYKKAKKREEKEKNHTYINMVKEEMLQNKKIIENILKDINSKYKNELDNIENYSIDAKDVSKERSRLKQYMIDISHYIFSQINMVAYDASCNLGIIKIVLSKNISYVYSNTRLFLNNVRTLQNRGESVAITSPVNYLSQIKYLRKLCVTLINEVYSDGIDDINKIEEELLS